MTHEIRKQTTYQTCNLELIYLTNKEFGIYIVFLI